MTMVVVEEGLSITTTVSTNPGSSQRAVGVLVSMGFLGLKIQC